MEKKNDVGTPIFMQDTGSVNPLKHEKKCFKGGKVVVLELRPERLPVIDLLKPPKLPRLG
jgi:hypothetical protein